MVEVNSPSKWPVLNSELLTDEQSRAVRLAGAWVVAVFQDPHTTLPEPRHELRVLIELVRFQLHNRTSNEPGEFMHQLGIEPTTGSQPTDWQ